MRRVFYPFSFIAASIVIAHCDSSLNVPSCPAGQVLSANGRELQCVAAPASDGGASIALPTCAAGQVLTSSDGVFRCVSVSGGDGGAAILVPQCGANEVVTAMGGALRCVATMSSAPGLPSCASGEVLTAADGGVTCVRPLGVPSCTAEQVLGVSGGALVCVTPPQPAPIPTCAAGQLLVAVDGGFACEAATATAIAAQNMQLATLQSSVTSLQSTLTTLQSTLTALTTRVSTLEGRPSGLSVGVYVGNTTTTTRGSIASRNGTIGVLGAAEICAAQFGAGARMCTVDELYRSVTSGAIAGSATVARAWVFNVDSTSNSGTPFREPTASLQNSCAGYTHPTANEGISGTAFEFSDWSFNSRRVLKFFVGNPEAACDRMLPIACCR